MNDPSKQIKIGPICYRKFQDFVSKMPETVFYSPLQFWTSFYICLQRARTCTLIRGSDLQLIVDANIDKRALNWYTHTHTCMHMLYVLLRGGKRNHATTTTLFVLEFWLSEFSVGWRTVEWIPLLFFALWTISVYKLLSLLHDFITSLLVELLACVFTYVVHKK